jgi:hypothetical protein
MRANPSTRARVSLTTLRFHSDETLEISEVRIDTIKRNMANYVASYVDDSGRVCTKCGKYKTREHFSIQPNSKYKGGMQSWCKECMSEYCKFRRQSQLVHVRRIEKESRAKIRLEVLSHYSGGTPKCACCGEREIDFLTIDHVNGGGSAHRRSLGGARGSGIYPWLRRNDYPDGFQVLCMNCNFAKGKYGTCPHQRHKARAIS